MPPTPSSCQDEQAWVPLRREGQHLFAPAVLAGEPVQMLLDTGADGSVFDAPVATRAGWQADAAPVPLTGGGDGVAQAWPWSPPPWRAAGLPQSGLAYVFALPAGLGGEGILGTPFFAAQRVHIDYPGSRMRAVSSACVDIAGNVPLRLLGGKPLVRAEVDGERGWFILDTGLASEAAVVLHAPHVARAGLRARYWPRIATPIGQSVGGTVRGELVRLRSARIGQHELRGAVGALSSMTSGTFAQDLWFEGEPVIGTLGAALAARFDLELDYRAGLLGLRPNADFAQVFTGPRSGLVLDCAEPARACEVTAVQAPSPAHEAGVAAGDRMIALNGRPVAAITRDEFWARLHDTPGTSLSLDLLRAGAPLSVSLTLRDLL